MTEPAAFRVRITLNQRTLDAKLRNLRTVASLPFISNALQINELKGKLLDFLRSIYPVSDGTKGRGKHIVTGFRTYDTSTAAKIGFVLQHAQAKNLRMQTILSSLEKGSKAYTQQPHNRNGTFSFFPGRGIHRNYNGWEFASMLSLKIPARPGGSYMSRTFLLAQQLIMEAKPAFFRQVQIQMQSNV